MKSVLVMMLIAAVAHSQMLLHCFLWAEKCCANANRSAVFGTLQGSNVVEDQDLLEIGILNSAHRQRLLQAIRLLPRVSAAANHSFQQEHHQSLNLSFLICLYISLMQVAKNGSYFKLQG